MIEISGAESRYSGRYGLMTFRSSLAPSLAERAGVAPLVVCDDCVLPPGTSFPMHEHRNDETISYVRSGELLGKDGSGTEIVLRAGSVGVMSAGRGMQHEEWVPDNSEPVRMYHIGIYPREADLEPRYLASEPPPLRPNAFRLLVSEDGRDASLPVYQDVNLYDLTLTPGRNVEYPIADGRAVWIVVHGGTLELNGRPLSEGDSATVRDEPIISLSTASKGELLLFDVNPNASAVTTGTRFAGM